MCVAMGGCRELRDVAVVAKLEGPKFSILCVCTDFSDT